MVVELLVLLAIGAAFGLSLFPLARSVPVQTMGASFSAELEQRLGAFAEQVGAQVEVGEVIRRHLIRWRVPVLSVEGVRDGRRVRVEVAPISRKTASRWTLRYAVHVPGAITEATLGRDAVRQRADARRGAQADEVEAALSHLFGLLGAERIELSGGWLAYEHPGDAYELTPGPLARVLDALSRVAPLYEGVALRPRATTSIAVRGWSVSGTVRCPFCREDLGLEGDDVGAEVEPCGACGTAHHAACLAEAGGCTVLGCAGRDRRRRPPGARVR